MVATAYHAAEANQPGICSRTQQAQDAILAVLPDVSDCANVSTSDLASITGTLDLSGQEIDTLHHEDLNGLTAVRVVDLSDNDLDLIPPDLFNETTSLEEMLVNDNALTRLPTNPWVTSHNLLRIDASNNAIDELHADAFPYPNLRYVDLSNNSIERLNGDEFDAATRIEAINLENNQLYGVAASWHGADNLQTLQLAGNPGAPFEISGQPGRPRRRGVPGQHRRWNSLPAGSRAIGNQRRPVPRHRDRAERRRPQPRPQRRSQRRRTGHRLHRRRRFHPRNPDRNRAHHGARRQHRRQQRGPGRLRPHPSDTGSPVRPLQTNTAPPSTKTSSPTLTATSAVVGAGIENFKTGDLAGLTSVDDLYLYGNQVSELPEGFFSGAGNFKRVLLQDNPGADFPLNLSVVRKADGSMAVAAREGTPFIIRVTLEADGGALSERVLYVYGGDTESRSFSTQPDQPGGTVNVRIAEAKFQDEWQLLKHSYYDGFYLKVAGHEEPEQDAAVAPPDPTPAPTATPAPTSPPPAPTNLTGTVNGDGAVTLSWNAPCRRHGDRIPDPQASAAGGRAQPAGVRERHRQHGNDLHGRRRHRRHPLRLPG